MSSPNTKTLKVFISYSHESFEHRLRVFELANWLRANGIECVTDHNVFSPPEGWRAWMEDQIKAADFALVVCTETYCRRAERREEPGKGLGVTWEAALITDEIYQNANRNTRFIPVVFSDEDRQHIPDRLKQATFYRVDIDDGCQMLLRHLVNKPLFEPVPLGSLPELPPVVKAVPEATAKQKHAAPSNQPSRDIPTVPKPSTRSSEQNFIEDLGNGVKLEMIAIRSGSFLMGSPEGVGDESEHPQHRVTLSPFHIGKYPITQAQWQAVMGKNPSQIKGNYNPVEQVSWNKAVKFCEKLQAKTGQAYRLPTEAEWEYACRADSTGKYCFGDQEKELDQYGWHYSNSGSTSHPVGQKKPNAWGLHDMHGNIAEWCQDVYDEGYYAHSEKLDPQGLPFGDDRVLRGGSWNGVSLDCRSASRDALAPGYRNDYVGLRVVVSARIL